MEKLKQSRLIQSNILQFLGTQRRRKEVAVCLTKEQVHDQTYKIDLFVESFVWQNEFNEKGEEGSGESYLLLFFKY